MQFPATTQRSLFVIHPESQRNRSLLMAALMSRSRRRRRQRRKKS
jgi:hypothetical protein